LDKANQALHVILGQKITASLSAQTGLAQPCGCTGHLPTWCSTVFLAAGDIYFHETQTWLRIKMEIDLYFGIAKSWLRLCLLGSLFY
jgi:hypothetical protein